jgi:cytidylate kinase
MIIGISGPTASGKTTVARLLAESTNAFRIKYSDILSQIAFERGLDAEDKATLQNLYLSEQKEKGPDFLCNALEEKVNSIDSPNIIIEGNRLLVDVAMLRRVASHKNDRLLLVYIDASVETRFARYNSRLEKNGELPVPLAAFMELEHKGTETQLDALRDIFKEEGLLVDANNSTPEAIFEEISQYLQV